MSLIDDKTQIATAPNSTDESWSMYLIIYEGVDDEAIEYKLPKPDSGEKIITFGRGEDNDIVLKSNYISRKRPHGRIICYADDGYLIEHLSTKNPPTLDNIEITSHVIQEGDIFRIDSNQKSDPKGVMMQFSKQKSDKISNWEIFDVKDKQIITIGRDNSCDIQLEHISVSTFHAVITMKNGCYFIEDNNSINGVSVNGKKVSGLHPLNDERDLIVITNSKLIFSKTRILYCCFTEGVRIEATNVIKRTDKEKVICNDVDLIIKPCEMVAILGGSGAGKSTLMNCLSGYSVPTQGHVSVNRVDLYENFSTLKSIIGYVPQSDIVHDNLSVFDMLNYAAKLRLPTEITEDNRIKRVNEVLDILDLSDHKDTFVKKLSGGQRKRASIAVELLSDLTLFFLDEPDSGLDPWTARKLMETLKSMTNEGKTVVFVTHNIDNLHLCNKIAFMGAGGNLCFCGNKSEVEEFFGTDDKTEIYSMIEDENDALIQKARYKGKPIARPPSKNDSKTPTKASNRGFFKQANVLFRRRLQILVNDRKRLLLILAQAPLLAFFIFLVSNENLYEDYTITKSILFALSCSAFWIGILNSIQEVCKERNILKREYMTGMRLDAYIFSIMLSLAILCLIQSLMLSSVFVFLTTQLPTQGALVRFGFIEVFGTAFLTALAASAMGIFVSSLFKHTDQAMTIAPLLLMPQMLFAGVIFELNRFTEIVSKFIVCRWSMDGFGATVGLNVMEFVMKDGIRIPRDYESIVEPTQMDILSSWGAMGLFVFIFSIMAIFSLEAVFNTLPKPLYQRVIAILQIFRSVS